MKPKIGDRVVTFRGTGMILRRSIAQRGWWVVRMDGSSDGPFVGWAMRPEDVKVIARESRR